MGAGASYTVSLTVTIDLDSIKITDLLQGQFAYFEANIIPSTTKWEVKSYYYDFTSDGVYDSDGLLYDVFSDNDKKIKGGKLYGFYPLWDSKKPLSKDEVLKSLKRNILSEIEIKASFSAGWLHQRLTRTFTFHEKYKYVFENNYFFVDKVDVNAPAIADAINEFFAHSHEIDEYYFSE